MADVVKKSSVIQVSLQHRDPEVAVRGLGQLMEAYQRRHVEVHRAIGVDTLLSQQTDQFRTRLMETERKLRNLKTNFVGVSIEDARKSLTEHLAKIRQDIFLAEADLASSFAASGRSPLATAITTNVPPSTNATALATNTASATNLASADATASPATISEYRSLCSRLDGLRSQELDLIALYKDENSRVKNVRQQIIETEVRKELMEDEYPSLLRIDTSVRAVGVAATTSPFEGDRLRIAGLQARYFALTNQLAQVRAELSVLDGIEGEVQQLQRAKELEEKNYRYYAAGLEQKKFDDALVGSKLENISIIQAPTPPSRENTKRSKIALGLLAGGILGGLAIAFLIEMFLDRSLKIPAHVEDRLHLPLFAAVPLLQSRTGVPPVTPSTRLIPTHAQSSAGISPASSHPVPPDAPDTDTGSRDGLPYSDAVASVEAESESGLMQPAAAVWSVGNPLRPHFETLRDRVLFYFEGNTRKPKLVGVTGCRHGSGVTTMAAGLAASLSETGGGNVLLVDLNLDHNTAHPFFHGRPGCGLADAVETDRREAGLVSENLYLAMGRNGVENGSDNLPLRLSQIVPKLRVSDYDYVVFDLPRVRKPALRRG